MSTRTSRSSPALRGQPTMPMPSDRARSTWGWPVSRASKSTSVQPAGFEPPGVFRPDFDKQAAHFLHHVERLGKRGNCAGFRPVRERVAGVERDGGEADVDGVPEAGKGVFVSLVAAATVADDEHGNSWWMW